MNSNPNYFNSKGEGRRVVLENGNIVAFLVLENDEYPFGIYFEKKDASGDNERLKTRIALTSDAAIALAELLITDERLRAAAAVKARRPQEGA